MNLFRLLPTTSTDTAGSSALTLDFNALPQGGQIVGGSTWSFQYLYRDPAAAGWPFNTTDAVRATFCN